MEVNWVIISVEQNSSESVFVVWFNLDSGERGWKDDGMLFVGVGSWQ